MEREEFRKTYKILPDVLVQDAVNHCAYLIPAKELERFPLDVDKLKKIGHETVTFTIPDNELVEALPPFLRTGVADRPSVLIQYRHGSAAFFLDFEELQHFRIEQPEDHLPATISFILPVSLELVEKIPLWRRRLLQSSTGRDDEEG